MGQVPWLQCWDGSLSAPQEGQARQAGEGVAPCARERLDCTDIAVRDDAVWSLWVRLKGTDTKADITVGVYYRLPTQKNGTDEPLGEISWDWLPSSL